MARSGRVQDGLPKLRNHLRGICGAEDGAAGDENVGAGARAELGGARIDAAVHLNVQFWIPRAQGGDFLAHRGVKLLATKPGLDGQAQDHVDETGVDELVHASALVARVDGLHATAARMPSERMDSQSSFAAAPLTTSIWNVTLDAPAAASAGTSVAGLLTLK